MPRERQQETFSRSPPKVSQFIRKVSRFIMRWRRPRPSYDLVDAPRPPRFRREASGFSERLSFYVLTASYRPREDSQSWMIWAICWLLLSNITMCSLPVMAPGDPG